MEVTAWNINPNRVWFVRLADAGASILVELYLTQADAQAQTDRQAAGDTSGFGSDLPVTLAIDPGASVPVLLYQAAHSWHLRISGADGDPTKIYKVKEFVDLDEISHPIYRNSALIETRARAEIDAHTHARIPRQVELGSHIPTLEPGDTVRLNSARRGKDEMYQALEHRMAGEINDDGEARLTSSISVAGYLALKR